MNVPLIAALVGVAASLGTAGIGALVLAAKAGVLISQVGEMRASLAKWMERVDALEKWRANSDGARERERELTGRHRMPGFHE
jgi:hypothetical protein